MKFLKVPACLPLVQQALLLTGDPWAHTRICLQDKKVVILLAGRYAGKKAVILKYFDEGTSGRPYGHASVCVLSKEPRKVRTSASTRYKLGRGDWRGYRLLVAYDIGSTAENQAPTSRQRCIAWIKHWTANCYIVAAV